MANLGLMMLISTEHTFTEGNQDQRYLFQNGYFSDIRQAIKMCNDI